MKKYLIMFLVFCLVVPMAVANYRKERIVRAAIGEAASEGEAGMLAVICAIKNRGTLDGVYGINAKHIDSEPQWVWRMARRAFYKSLWQDVTKGATHWESTDFDVPYWAKDMVQTVQIGKHKFYKKGD